jgi:hypothetical protein
MAIRRELEDLIGDISIYGPLDIPAPTVEHAEPAPITPPQKFIPHKPETILQLETMLDEFGWQVVTHAGQVRHLVTNKLLALSDHPDPKIQLRAIELLGKIADVGMFVDKQEITLKHTSDEELRKKLREKLGLVIEGGVGKGVGVEVVEVEVEVEVISHTPITPKDMKIPFV